MTDQEFIYRIYPDPADKAVFFGIVHTPTPHRLPAD
ncbi:hypothetical protein [Nocardia donostiensis]